MSENTTNINNKLTVRKAAVDPATIIDSDYLFSLQPYIEGGNLDGALNLTNGNKGNYTIETINDVDAPYGKVVKFPTGQQALLAGYDIDIPVNAGDRLYTEVTYMIPADDAGTESRFYLGFSGYDKDKKIINSNNGVWTYVVSNITLTVDGDWHTVGGYAIVPSTHTPYNGSDGGAVRYMNAIVLVNLGGGDREVYLSNLKVRKVETNNDEGDTAFKGNVGIGTDDPDVRLHIIGGAAASGLSSFIVENSEDTHSKSLEIFDNRQLQLPAYGSGLMAGASGSTTKVLNVTNTGLVFESAPDLAYILSNGSDASVSDNINFTSLTGSITGLAITYITWTCAGLATISGSTGIVLGSNTGDIELKVNTSGDVTLQAGASNKVISKSIFQLHKVSSDPTGYGTDDAGSMYFNTTTNKFRGWNGTSWVDLG